eukprot:TRINITY_DN7992_c1_g1_i1.p1 TRINITY_DN7992_c1_g1~~TRINITY_DN7992_c1_g1_i1.p1  ORF type:complete len:236 (-),score=38.63 TRINITY_DN7992_c1_g1_i1:159-866(-)
MAPLRRSFNARVCSAIAAAAAAAATPWPRFVSGAAFVSPPTIVATAMTMSLAQLRGHRRVGVHRPFFALTVVRAAASTSEDGSSCNNSSPTTNAEDQQQAAQMRKDASQVTSASASDSELAELPGAIIDEGTFKYVLLSVTSKTGDRRYLVRGTLGAAYHKDVALPYVRAYLKKGFEVEILGGGRILRDSERKVIRIYGFSYGFPWVEGAGHEISATVCEEVFPDYKVDWSNEGY